MSDATDPRAGVVAKNDMWRRLMYEWWDLQHVAVSAVIAIHGYGHEAYVTQFC